MSLREHLAVAPCPGGIIAKVQDHGGWLASAVLMGLPEALGPEDTLHVDLAACTHIDSSFVGALVRLHHRLENDSSCALLICAPTAGVMRVFETMRLEGLLRITAQPPPLPTAEFAAQDLVGATGDQRAVAQHVRACHAALAAVPGPHRDACRAVVEQLERELGTGRYAR